MNTDDLPPLRDVVAALDLSAKRSLGQNFLFDMNITRKIVRAAGVLENTTVYEVGPGPGGLTRALLETPARKIVAVEKDHRFIAALNDLKTAYPGRLDIIEENALELDEESILSADSDVRIVSNLPYNVASPLLVKWLESADWPPWYRSMTLMFQREVAERIVAKPGNRDYGRLSVLSQWRTRPHLLFNLPASAFVPPPKVSSAVVGFEVLDGPVAPAQLRTLTRVTKAAFGQRRKMLRRSLRQLSGDSDELLNRAGVNPQARAEELTAEQFAAIARALDED